MKIGTRPLVLFAAAVAAALSIAATPPAAAPAGSKDGVCDSGEFCLYTKDNQFGDVVDRVKYEDDIDGTVVGREGARSWYNGTGYGWYVYDGPKCSGHSAGPLSPNDYDDVAPEWVYRIKSIARAGATNTCRGLD
ncbi:peptidase inhibitor family I36 protein [Streptomyces sp. NPDC001709]